MAIRSHTKKEVLHASIQGVLGNVSMPTKFFWVVHGHTWWAPTKYKWGGPESQVLEVISPQGKSLIFGHFIGVKQFHL